MWKYGTERHDLICGEYGGSKYNAIINDQILVYMTVDYKRYDSWRHTHDAKVRHYTARLYILPRGTNYTYYANIKYRKTERYIVYR